MMLELWWKVLLASLATVVLAKLLGASYGVFALFLMAWVGWTAVLVGVIYLSRFWTRPRKGQDQDKPGA